jgi:hypothetical protein
MAADGMSLDLAKVPAYAEFVAARNISNVMPAAASCGGDDFRELLTGETTKNLHRRAW